jgi:hypothetical protein
MAGQSPLAFIANLFSGAIGAGRLDQQRALWETQRHGKYYASTYGTPIIPSPLTAARAGANFRGSNSASATLSAGLATTYTGLCLSNPATATVNLKVRRFAGAMFAAPGTFIALGLISGWAAAGITVHTTAINTNILNGYIGAAPTAGSIVGPAPQANLDAACTLVGTPLWDRWITGNASSGALVSFAIDLDDDTIIPPGGYMAIGANVAGPAGFLGTAGWEEIAP